MCLFVIKYYSCFVFWSRFKVLIFQKFSSYREIARPKWSWAFKELGQTFQFVYVFFTSLCCLILCSRLLPWNLFLSCTAQFSFYYEGFELLLSWLFFVWVLILLVYCQHLTYCSCLLFQDCCWSLYRFLKYHFSISFKILRSSTPLVARLNCAYFPIENVWLKEVSFEGC